jgi:hypothetical protein
MNILQLIQNEYVSLIAGGAGGLLSSWFSQRILSRRGLFTYFVRHEKIGVSAEDKVFGSVAVSWNGKSIANLYLSSLQLKNESMNDYENVVIRAYTDDTRLLSEQTQILDSPNIVEWTEKFKADLKFEAGTEPTERQVEIYNGQREYLVPVLNRGQSIQLTFLNSSKSKASPSIWLSVALKGVKLKFRVPQKEVFGVSQAQAALVGVLIAIAVVCTLTAWLTDLWSVALLSLLMGLFAVVPGAYAIKLFRRLKEAIGG